MGLLRKYKKNEFELAEACKFPEEVIRDWRAGLGQRPWPGHLVKLARAFGKSRTDVCENHLSLLYALLLDDWQGPAAKFINIEVLPKALPIVANVPSLRPIKRSSELDLAVIRKHIWHDSELQKKIREIALPLKNKPIPQSE